MFFVQLFLMVFKSARGKKKYKWFYCQYIGFMAPDQSKSPSNGNEGVLHTLKN